MRFRSFIFFHPTYSFKFLFEYILYRKKNLNFFLNNWNYPSSIQYWRYPIGSNPSISLLLSLEEKKKENHDTRQWINNMQNKHEERHHKNLYFKRERERMYDQSFYMHRIHVRSIVSSNCK